MQVTGSKVVESVLERTIDWVFKEKAILLLEIKETHNHNKESEFMSDLKKI